MVELASVRDPSSTVAAIATAVDVQQRQHLSIEETLMECLRGRRSLLVLDNCEHLRATIAPLVDRLLSWCPDVTILATSREVLGLPGEQVWRGRTAGDPAARCRRRGALGIAGGAPVRPTRHHPRRRTSSSDLTTPRPSPRSCAASMDSHSPLSSRRPDCAR